MAPSTTTAKEADYIVVGGGTAGLVVANRLSEDPSASVLVLEAGADLSADPRVSGPALFMTLFNTDADWAFRTVPQAGLRGRRVDEPQGRALGGSSAINGQAFVAPAAAGIDAWAAMGCEGWGWEALRPYFRRCCTLTEPDEETRRHLGVDWLGEEDKGTDGPLKVYFPAVKENPVAKSWIEAFKGMGKITSGDPFSGKSVGAYSNLATVDPAEKVRSYSYSAYGAPAAQRNNVRLVTQATVQKIVFSQPNSSGDVRATGVQLSVAGGNVETFSAKKEVILAAGVFNTPKVLELSGVGQKDLLEKHGVPIVVDSPGVGENLQNHLHTAVSYEVADGVATVDALMRQEPEALAEAQRLYIEKREGPLTVGGIQSHAYMPLPDSARVPISEILDQNPPSAKDTAFVGAVRSIVEREDESSCAWFIFPAQGNLHEETRDTVMPQNFLTFALAQCYPFSRGSSHISSADAGAAPAIDPRYFSHPADLELMARHLQELDKLRQRAELAAYLKPDGARNHPDSFLLADPEVARRYTLDTARSTYHCCGTAAMLPCDKGGVVDSRLVVYGTENLRVVDASVFPLIPRGNIQSTVYAVAERAADIIKKGV